MSTGTCVDASSPTVHSCRWATMSTSSWAASARTPATRMSDQNPMACQRCTWRGGNFQDLPCPNTSRRGSPFCRKHFHFNSLLARTSPCKCTMGDGSGYWHHSEGIRVAGSDANRTWAIYYRCDTCDGIVSGIWANCENVRHPPDVIIG